MTLVICDAQVAEIWVNGRAPLITIRDYDWGETDRAPIYDCDGFAYTKINWRHPPWALGLSLSPRLQGNIRRILPTKIRHESSL